MVPPGTRQCGKQLQQVIIIGIAGALPHITRMAHAMRGTLVILDAESRTPKVPVHLLKAMEQPPIEPTLKKWDKPLRQHHIKKGKGYYK